MRRGVVRSSFGARGETSEQEGRVRMSEAAVEISHVSKSYRLGGWRAFWTENSLAEGLRRELRRAGSRLRGIWAGVPAGGAVERPGAFWALRDVTFEVPRGRALAFVGRNGAGKSTLLKILSRITPPTEGRVVLRGRSASLLEVGTGFHPELTGRENIYLNGSLIGMKKVEIDRRFEEIVEFSGIGAFLDTPVKRYSSGMYVRLAFSVAAHLETDILMVDEVLAVGDAQFQEKCLGRMRAVTGEEGRTVIFVSHNAGAVQQLCEGAVLFESGRVKAAGPAAEILQRYLGEHRLASVVDLGGEGVTRGRSKDRVFERMELLDEAGQRAAAFEPLSVMRIRLELDIPRALELPSLLVRVNTARGDRLYVMSSQQGGSVAGGLGRGRVAVECRLMVPPLVPGVYGLEFALVQQYWRTEYVDEVVGGLGFEIVPSADGGAVAFEEDAGSLLVHSEWRVLPLGDCNGSWVRSADGLGEGRPPAGQQTAAGGA